MPWVRFDDQFPIHRKVDSLSDPAFRLHVSAIFWCARNLTDGCVPEGDLDYAAPRKMKRPDRFVAELVGRGLWHPPGQGCESGRCPAPVEHGWAIHDYLEFQPSRSKIEKEREAKAERQRRWLEKRKTRLVEKPVDRDASTDATVDASKDAAPPRPAPKEGGGGDAPAAPERRSRGAAGRAHPPGSPDRATRKDSQSVNEALARSGCPHGAPAGVGCALCRRGIPAEEVS